MMNIYRVKRVETTPANKSIDGKKHVHTYWYGGIRETPIGNAFHWGQSKRDAYPFTLKADAERFVRRFYPETGEIVKDSLKKPPKIAEMQKRDRKIMRLSEQIQDAEDALQVLEDERGSERWCMWSDKLADLTKKRDELMY